ncbi:MFS transporter [Chloroflexus aggregans]|uniref:hypothetical protein n=1 Tax=Chloroflexus aggregans TaxID=152260 RepID=UPI0000E7ECD3|nr:hypothetical protein [Chloroflexus aggregans]
MAAFAAIAMGGLGSVVAGALADRLSRTTITIAAMAISGGCALVIRLAFGGKPWLVTGLDLLWGLTVVADSAQFSAAVSELSPPRTHRHRFDLANQLGLSTYPDHDLAGAAAGGLGWLAVGLCWAGAWAGDWHLGDGDAPAIAGGGALGRRAGVSAAGR